MTEQLDISKRSLNYSRAEDDSVTLTVKLGDTILAQEFRYRDFDTARDAYKALEKRMGWEPVVVMLPRFKRWYYDGGDPDGTVCDCVYTDRRTGKDVFWYDAADPANHRDLGTESDEDILRRRGHNPDERIPATESFFLDERGMVVA